MHSIFNLPLPLPSKARSHVHFLGLEAIYYLTQTNQKLSIFLEAWDGETRTANYSTFYIDGIDQEYVNHVSKKPQEEMSEINFAKRKNHHTFNSVKVVMLYSRYSRFIMP